MPRKSRENQVNGVLEPELYARLQAYLQESGLTLTHVLNRAIRRDLSAPPVVSEPPLPPAPPEQSAARAPGGKRARKPKEPS
jgi:hypothetical protein